MKIVAAPSTLVCPRVGDHRRTSLMYVFTKPLHHEQIRNKVNFKQILIGLNSVTFLLNWLPHQG